MDSKWTDAGKVLLLKSDIKNIGLNFPGTAAPGTPEEGQSYWNTTDNRPQWYDGSAWKKIGDLIIPAGADDILLLDGIAGIRCGYISYKDTDEVYIDGNCMIVKDKIANWDSQLTYDVGSPTASTWHYIYLDYSAITNRTSITTSEIINSTTAPTYSHTLKGWYNGDDRCIGCFLTDGSSQVLPFDWLKSDGMYCFRSEISVLASGTATTYTGQSLTAAVPNFGVMKVYLLIENYDADNPEAGLHLRPTGYTDTGAEHGFFGFHSGYSDATSNEGKYTTIGITDSSQSIDYKVHDGDDWGNIYVWGFWMSF